MKIEELKKWLRDNSAGTYRPSAEAADVINQMEDILRKSVDALRANGVFHTPVALRRCGGREWDEYEIDAINRTKDALAAAGNLSIV